MSKMERSPVERSEGKTGLDKLKENTKLVAVFLIAAAALVGGREVLKQKDINKDTADESHKELDHQDTARGGEANEDFIIPEVDFDGDDQIGDLDKQKNQTNQDIVEYFGPPECKAWWKVLDAYDKGYLKYGGILDDNSGFYLENEDGENFRIYAQRLDGANPGACIADFDPGSEERLEAAKSDFSKDVKALISQGKLNDIMDRVPVEYGFEEEFLLLFNSMPVEMLEEIAHDDERLNAVIDSIIESFGDFRKSKQNSEQDEAEI